jgi:hypothetical protein
MLIFNNLHFWSPSVFSLKKPIFDVKMGFFRLNTEGYARPSKFKFQTSN